jgi:hypothetical protein
MAPGYARRVRCSYEQQHLESSPSSSRCDIVSGKWNFRHKFHSNGSPALHKARWVVCGFTQHPDIDFDETFSLVVKLATIRVVLCLAISQSWPIHQLDVKNAFLHGNLDEKSTSSNHQGLLIPVIRLTSVVFEKLSIV